MEQSMMIINNHSQNDQMIRKETEPWFNEQNLNINQEQPLSSETPYYKYQNNIGVPVGISTNIQWWRDSSITNIVMQSEYQPEIARSSNCSLMNHCISAQLSDQLEEVELNSTKAMKSKQLKKSKTMKVCREPLKRTKNPEMWKVNVKKNARLRGEEYIGVGGKIVPAKTMGPPCKCRIRCTEKIDEVSREELHNVFWKTCSWEQRKQYVALLVKESPKQRTRCRGNVKSEHRRQVTFTYSLLLKGEFITVCKCMFLSTFSVSEKFVRHVMEKKRISPGGIIGPDQRGKHIPKTKKSESVKDRVREHIRSFPTEKLINPKNRIEKGYLDSRLSIAAMHKLYVLKCKEEGVFESDIVKESYYREMFKTEFNLGFEREESKDGKQLPGII
ncbi:uncharacterized protein LOC143306069 isoform X2 [Osmia lignaria lignaria]|uniref:uncharacterized protein LOC143306069 isoform X2 n=1 Tax=Osmia lignaria lignaria TaxID=1437193 RepID=UPI00402B31CA